MSTSPVADVVSMPPPVSDDKDTPNAAEEATPEPTTEVTTESKSGPHEDLVVEEEVTTGNWNIPKVEVKEVESFTGEEDEACVWKHRSKLYRWSNGEWKERGLGDSKLLKDKAGRIRFLLRQEKTGKIVANHYIVPKDEMCKLTPNAGSDKIWVWSVLDCSEQPHVVEQFGLRFGQVEAATNFKEEFEKAAASNKEIYDQGKF